MIAEEVTEPTQVESSPQNSAPPESRSTESPQPTEQPDGSVDSESFTAKAFDPKEAARWTPDKLTEAYKGMQGDYTRKTQAIANSKKEFEARSQGYETQLSQLQSQLGQIQGMAMEVLRDPTKLESYRNVYGPQLGITQPKADEMPQLETKEDLLRYLNDQKQQITQSASQRVRQELYGEIKRQQDEVGWEKAVESNATDPVFTKYKDYILNMIQDPTKDFIGKYRRGELDKNGVIAQGLKEFKKTYTEDLEQAKQEGLGKTLSKKKATTLSPSKSVSTEPSNQLSDDEIISRVQRQLG